MGDPARGDARFEIRGTLGSGATGVVYAAFDRRLGQLVALKTLHRATGRDLYRFKREFRSLADIVHPNLAALHELHTDGEEWFFTMELVDGTPFIDWVRPRRPTADGRLASRVDAPVDLERLGGALAQLVDGVLALHVCGKLHRDLKPSNVLVRGDGRVVLLDFGLVSDVESAHADITHEQAAVGTPAYMSPEQVRDEPLTEASDWYAVGVMLYQALTGRRPFEGSSQEIMHRKQREAPVPPRELDPNVPRRLDELCRRLLARDPRDRPDGRSLLAALGRGPSAASRALERAVVAGPFVGREGELEVLRAAMAASRDHGVAVFVRGDSGIGKTRLVRHFLDEADDAMLLEGRCYERESVPYKTLDAVIDSLTATLLRLPEPALASLIPLDVAALARLFPVLRRVGAIAGRCAGAALPPDPAELRRRGFGALRALLGRLAELGRLVIAIDDLQWGDVDSAVFLADLIHHPDPVPLLLILVHRHDDTGAVERMREAGPGLPAGDVRQIDLGPLAAVDARQLVGALGSDVDDRAELLVREGGGHPLFLIELARSANVVGGEVPTLDQMISRRIAALSEPAAALLRTAAVAAHPMPIEQAAAAAGLSAATSELAQLRAEHLVRVRRLGDSDTPCVEPYHDRIRAAAVATLTGEDHRSVHKALARTLEAAGGDLEGLVAHWLGADRPMRASTYAVRAAEVAEEALAFHRAAQLYELALRHGRYDERQRRDLHRRRAMALANAGSLEAAAEAFGQAAAGAPPDEAMEMDRLRLQQLVRRGRLDEGLALLRSVLGRVGISMPSNASAALRAAMVERVHLRLRGLDFKPRRPEQIPPEVARRVAALYTTAGGLAFVNPVIGRPLQLRFLREALASGDLRQIGNAMANEVGYLSLPGAKNKRRIDEMAMRLDTVTSMVGDPGLTGFASFFKGVSAFILGQWRAARDLLEDGIRAMRDHAVGLRWEINLAELYDAATLFYLGETREMSRRVPLLLREAIDRGDVYAQHGLRGWRSNVAWLVMGRPEEARAHAAAVAAARTRADGFHLQHYFELLAQTQIDLFVGDVDAGWRRMQAAWPLMSKTYLLRIQSIAIEAYFLRARVLLARAFRADRSERAPLTKEARQLAAQLDHERAGWASAIATQIRGLLTLLDDDDGAAGALLERAERAFRQCDMSLMATVMRRRRGELAAGAAGAALVAASDDAMAAQAIAEPAAMARMLCPWPRDRA